MADYNGDFYLVKSFADNTAVYYMAGKFDKWCVYYHTANSWIPLRDGFYFSNLAHLAKTYGTDKVYNDFAILLNATDHISLPDSGLLMWLTNQSKCYGQDALMFEKTMTILYATMIAEENKKFAVLGKFIKALGVYELLYMNKSVPEVVQSYIGVPARVLWEKCKCYGIVSENASFPSKRKTLPKNISEYVGYQNVTYTPHGVVSRSVPSGKVTLKDGTKREFSEYFD